MKSWCWALLLPLVAASATHAALELDWDDVARADVVEILTGDGDGQMRETTVWIVVLDGHGYVRTNDSRWLANIRRGSPVALRLGEQEWAVDAEETNDPELLPRLEEAFKEKYGFTQRVMSFFRFREPTVLRLTAL